MWNGKPSYLRNEFLFMQGSIDLSLLSRSFSDHHHGAMNRSGFACNVNISTFGVHINFASDPLWFIAPWISEILNSLLTFKFIASHNLFKKIALNLLFTIK